MDSVGRWYQDFSPTTDQEVIALLDRGAGRATAAPATREVTLPGPAPGLPGELRVPAGPLGLVLFAHGSGSGRHSPRNQLVASVLNDAGLATLLFDLLSSSEERDRQNVFDIALIGSRLANATRWALAQPTLALPIGYFGASTGAAAALWAAAEPDLPVAAIVSRGGRPDLAGPRLGHVRAPTLLIVGGNDELVIDLNQRAARALRCEHQLLVVPGATHVFPEPGALETVATLARQWFTRYLAPRARIDRGA
jgi:putative phosphoribosyl transferase